LKKNNREIYISGNLGGGNADDRIQNPEYRRQETGDRRQEVGMSNEE
jgi:hypothetical protein